MEARRLGRVFDIKDGPDWMVSHAAYPTPILLSDHQLRVFIVSRDDHQRGSVGWVDLDPKNPTRVIAVSSEPALRPGSVGTFSDRGISIGSIHARPDGALWMYFLGWNKSADVPFRNSIGLAIDVSGRGDRFEPAFEGPIIDRSRHDPFTLSYPYVTPPSSETNKWHMLYGTSRGGGTDERKMQHALTEAWSHDGVDWSPTGRDVISLEVGEYGLSRPWCFVADGARFLLFAIRRQRYTLGYARWDPATNAWHREASDLLGAGSGWDGEATCYPAVIQIRGRTLLFYNGNGYGRTGFGVAELI